MMFKDVPLRTRRALSLYKVCGDSALLVLNGTSLNSVNAFLALSRGYLNLMPRTHLDVKPPRIKEPHKAKWSMKWLTRGSYGHGLCGCYENYVAKFSACQNLTIPSSRRHVDPVIATYTP